MGLCVSDERATPPPRPPLVVAAVSREGMGGYAPFEEAFDADALARRHREELHPCRRLEIVQSCLGVLKLSPAFVA